MTKEVPRTSVLRDEELNKTLIARLRDLGDHASFEPHMHHIAADRIEELTKERDQHWDSFVHWRKEADDRSEQLAAARQDAKEAEAYAEELADKLSICERHRDAYAEMDRIGTQAVRDLEAKLAKAVEALDGLMSHMPDYADTAWQDARATLAEIKGERHE